jgi:hypothetical protein
MKTGVSTTPRVVVKRPKRALHVSSVLSSSNIGAGEWRTGRLAGSTEASALWLVGKAIFTPDLHEGLTEQNRVEVLLLSELSPDLVATQFFAENRRESIPWNGRNTVPPLGIWRDRFPKGWDPNEDKAFLESCREDSVPTNGSDWVSAVLLPSD